MKVFKNRTELWARVSSSKRALFAVLITGFTAAACNSSTDPQVLSTITVSPGTQTLEISATQQFTAVGRDSDGDVMTIIPTWSIVSGGGTINPVTGMFTAGTTPGIYSATVRATSGGMFGDATVTVAVGPLATISITPGPVTVNAGATQLFTAVGRDAGGNVVTLVPAWTVVTGGGTINSTTGLFTAGSTGGTFTNTVRAGSGSVAAFATVSVTAAP